MRSTRPGQLHTLNWRKASHSSGSGGCVKIADARHALDRVAIRDSKVADSPVTLVPPTLFAALIARLGAGVD